MKKLSLIVAVLAVMTVFSSAKPSGKLREVRFATTMDCPKCVRKVTENLSFERGVKDLETTLETKEVKVVYDPSRTDTLSLASALRKLGYKAKVIEDRAL